MSEVIKLRPYINGQYVESKTEKYTDAYSPSTGEVVAKVPCCTQDEVEMAIAAAKAAFPGWSSTPVIKRVQILYKVRELLIEHMDELTELVATENGKAWDEALSMQIIHLSLELLKKIFKVQLKEKMRNGQNSTQMLNKLPKTKVLMKLQIHSIM